MSEMIKQFRAARNANCGLVAIETADYAQTINTISREVVGKGDYVIPKLRWDFVEGCAGINEPGKQLDDILFPRNLTGQKPPSNDPTVFLKALAQKKVVEKQPEPDPNHPYQQQQPILVQSNEPLIYHHTIIFVLNAQRYIDSAGVVQGIWNLRDLFKQVHCTLVLLSPTTVKLPKELSSDFFFIHDPVPRPEQIKSIITELLGPDGISGHVPEGKDMEDAVNACLGLSDFCVEQNIALAYNHEEGKLNIEELWQNKRELIRQQQGLEVNTSGKRFEELGGLSNVKQFLQRAVSGKRKYKTVVFIEEIDKIFAGAGTNGGPGDSSGVTQDQLGVVLDFMQENKILGVLLLGPPGTGKSELAKAAGVEINVPSIKFDLGGCKGSLVGQSEQNTRSALNTIRAVSDGDAIFIASCNRLDSIPPELRRRFSAAFFVDLPNEEERKAAWDIWKKNYDVPNSDSLPKGADIGWSGAEIAQCCMYASQLNLTLEEASIYIAPVALTSKEQIEGLRRGANGHFLSAHAPGFYEYWPINPEQNRPVVLEQERLATEKPKRRTLSKYE